MLLPSAKPVQAAAVPAFDHVFVIVMENHSYNQIIGSTAAPYINSLATSNGLATGYSAVAHPSLPNYLALAGGSTFGITSDCTTCWISAPNLGDNLEAAGKTWKTYQESMPSACFVGDSYPYVQKHNPFIYFNNIRTNATRCQSHLVPYSSLASDLASASTTPNFAFITPNSCNDMHDCSVGTGDAWLQQQVPSILGSAAFTTQHSLLALLWDEDDFSGTNHVPLILAGNGIAAGSTSGLGYNHYSLLHTAELALGAATLTASDASAVPMTDFFAATPAGWSSVGGRLTSNPAVASWTSGRLDLFARGADNGLWHRAWTGTAWQAWESIGGGLMSSPAATSGSANRLDVFARGGDNALWHRTWDGAQWQPWESLGGVSTSGPASAASSMTRIDIFVRGGDNALWHRWWDGATWRPWESLGGLLASDPGSAWVGSGRLDVFARGVDGALWHKSFNGTAWSAWESLGGQVLAAAAASSCTASTLDVFAVGADQGLWRRTFNGSAWSAWAPAGGAWTSGPAAVCEPGTSKIDVFERGADFGIWRLETA